MTDIRESHIIVRSGNYNPETAKFKLDFFIRCGKNEYAANFQKIQSLGIEPSNNVLVITHEFATEEAAQDAVEKLAKFYGDMSSQLGPLAQACEAPKTQGKTIIVPLRIPEMYAAYLMALDPIFASLEDITNTHQYIQLSIGSAVDIKESFSKEDTSPIAAFAAGSILKFALCTHKDLPKRVTALASEMGAPGDKKTLLTVGEIASSINHITLEVELAESTADAKEAFKNEIMMGTMMGAQMVCGMAEQFGLMDVAKNGGTKTTATLCISPAISLEFSLFAPTAFDTLQSMAAPA